MCTAVGHHITTVPPVVCVCEWIVESQGQGSELNTLSFKLLMIFSLKWCINKGLFLVVDDGDVSVVKCVLIPWCSCGEVCSHSMV